MDIVVTVPMNFTHECAPGKKGLAAWIAEGDAAGASWSGVYWAFTVAGMKPPVEPGDRIYVVCERRLRGYAPLVELRFAGGPYCRGGQGVGTWELIRTGGAVAVTIPAIVTGFRGWLHRWWDRNEETPFPDWETA